ncbi:M16 family metallopeptidase [Thalassobacter stenotrophicus]|uniref:Peptidase M16 inactive domain protein n=2 Tax=Thalassobacter stenotrophicus TaxID=266809 RepID=A0A0P1FI74_9RHOB|nr:pitrilysin family protein [Thalassobacter stenotrophicus]PVZ49448.1 peptidase M16 [Thalassobacter stenotrophicus]CUH60685.1 Peptidase M16 inactive domain protein [Thalassobacter stenotrophicus]SHJ31596.1 zinc protease [Thalassobacter stenotrophicus DSM 16310]
MMLRFALIIAVLVPFGARAAVEIQEVTSPGGITAWLVEEPSIPFVAMDIRFKGGSSLDPEGKRGATYMMMGLLEEGAGDRDARAFTEATEAVAANFGFDTFRDSVQIEAQFLTENREESLALLRDAIKFPRFDQDAIDRVQTQIVSIIEGNETDPNDIAGTTLAALSYPGHPYATAQEGTVESVNALTRADLIAAHEAVFARDRVYIGVTGDISAAELGPLLDTLLGDLPATGAPMPVEAELALEGGQTIVDYRSPQSVVLFGHAGVDRDDPDFFPAFVANHILGGGGFESRLMVNVRERRGLTYGISSFLASRDYGNQWLGQFSTSNENVGPAIDLIQSIWDDMAENGVTPEELDAAQTYLTGAYPLRFDGNGRIAGILAGMQAQGLGVDYIETRNDQVNAVTLEDIQRVAAEHLVVEDMHFVIVGQPQGFN